jgi:hypothetical protein
LLPSWTWLTPVSWCTSTSSSSLGSAGPGIGSTGIARHRVRGIGWEYVHVCVDDTSRLAFVEVLDDERAPTCVGFLRRAVAWFATLGVRVQRVMTDIHAEWRLERAWVVRPAA